MYGAEAVILNLSRILNESHHQSALGVFSNSVNKNLDLYTESISEKNESYLIPCQNQIDLSVFDTIRELVINVKPDVVHAHGYKADVYVYYALRKSRIPLVSTCHGWFGNDFRSRVYKAIDQYVLRRYAAVIAVSDHLRTSLLEAGVSGDHVSLIENGIDLRPFTSAIPSLREYAKGGILVGLIGRLSQEKGIDIFLRAVSIVVREFPVARFVIVGDGPDRNKLNALIASLKLEENVFLLGRRDDMPSVYASLDLMVSSSRQEGLPMAILEGMASRLPVLATRVGSVPAVVINNQTGVLVPPENVSLLADAMISLLRDEAERMRLGRAGRDLIVQKFSADRMTTDYLHVYRRVVEATF